MASLTHAQPAYRAVTSLHFVTCERCGQPLAFCGYARCDQHESHPGGDLCRRCEIAKKEGRG